MGHINSTHSTTVCKLCGDQIDAGWLERHQARCEKRTPEARIAARESRIAGRESYRRAMRAKRGLPQSDASIERPPTIGKPKLNVLFPNGNSKGGKCLSLTISIDFDTLRELLIQLAPSLNIDKVEIR